MHVGVQVIANGTDITALLADRLLDLSITDEAGMQADTATLDIDDRDGRITLPPPGATLDIALGYLPDGLVSMGSYVVDEISGSGPLAQISITATAADMGSSLRDPKTRSWENVSLEALISTIAGEHGLRPVIAPSLQTVSYPYLAQTAESDLNFLTRLALKLDATAKPAGGALLVVPRGLKADAAQFGLPSMTITPAMMADWSWQMTNRGRYAKVTAIWSETDTAQARPVVVGSGTPALVLRHRHASADEAKRAATAALEHGDRASNTLSVTLGGFAGTLSAESTIILADVKPEIQGPWVVKSVQHSLTSDTLTTKFKAERASQITPSNGQAVIEAASV